MEILSCLMLVKNAGIHTVLCVGQLQLVSDFIARIFKGSEHTVQIYRKIHCFSKRMSDNIHIRYLIIFQYCLQIPFCILDVLWKQLFHLVLRQDVKQVSVWYFFLYKIEMSRSVQMRFVQLDETAIKMYPSGSEEGTGNFRLERGYLPQPLTERKASSEIRSGCSGHCPGESQISQEVDIPPHVWVCVWQCLQLTINTASSI